MDLQQPTDASPAGGSRRGARHDHLSRAMEGTANIRGGRGGIVVETLHEEIPAARHLAHNAQNRVVQQASATHLVDRPHDAEAAIASAKAVLAPFALVGEDRDHHLDLVESRRAAWDCCAV
jgi:hypothetical protein